MFLGIAFSCRKQIDIELPEYKEKLVVEGIIETGQIPVVILTKSVGYFDPINAETFANLFVHDAIVKINNGDKEIQLIELCISDLSSAQIEGISTATGISTEELIGLSYCVYTTISMIGENEKSYTLSIEHEGKKWTSTTTIPKPVPLDSAWFEVFEGEDTLGFVWAKLSDPTGETNNYRWFTQRINKYNEPINGDPSHIGTQKDNRFIAPIGSAFDDKFFNGISFEFNYYRGEEPNSAKPDDHEPFSGFFEVGDTVIVKFTSIDRKSYLYLTVFEDQVATEGSPFASPSTIPTNIEGDEPALGAWIGYAPSFHTVICK
ncbi:MAG: DUF4249 domain-containing protein [Bacteroidia bacterium]